MANIFKLECEVFTGRVGGLSNELVDFGIFSKNISIKNGDHPEIFIDKDIAAAILNKIKTSNGDHPDIDYKLLFERYLEHVQEMYGHCCLDDAGISSSSVPFSDVEIAYFKSLNLIN